MALFDNPIISKIVEAGRQATQQQQAAKLLQQAQQVQAAKQAREMQLTNSRQAVQRRLSGLQNLSDQNRVQSQIFNDSMNQSHERVRNMMTQNQQALQSFTANVPRGIVQTNRGTSKPATGGGSFQSFLNAIAKQESGGRYDAKGVRVKSGDRAYGKYQIMGNNFLKPGGWDKEALGRDVTLQEYMNNPDIQETMARHKLKQYFDRYGAADAAAAWYGGPGAVKSKHRDAPQSASGKKFPSINQYANAILNKMR